MKIYGVSGSGSIKEIEIPDMKSNIKENFYGGVKTRGGAFYSPMMRKASGETFPANVPTFTFASPHVGTGAAITTAPIFYDIRYFTPDKFYFPRDEKEANDVWRLVYKRDPIVGAAIDLYADFAWSEFDLLGVDDPSIRAVYEDMCEEVGLLAKLPDMSREFLITGKVIPHLIFDTSKGYWRYLIIHNPNWIQPIFVPFVGTEPILYLVLPEEIRRMLLSPDPIVQKVISKMPPQLRSLLETSAKIPLDNVNVSYIPRRVLASDFVGTSLLERVYRMLMYEDFLMNASLAVAQRQAVPLRLFKLGDHERNWFPTKEDEEALAEALAIAEADPLAALIYHSGIEVEYVGVSDRFWNISREWDFIENLKLIGLGVSKSFLLGESSFASAVAGLQTFVQKVAGLRMKFEQEWIIPKFFKTIAIMNEFYKYTPAELSHRLRVREKERELIIPSIRWRRSLEPTQDTSILSVWRELHDKGIISSRTYAAGAGVNIDIERKNIREELEYMKEFEKFKKELGIEKSPEGGAGGFAFGGSEKGYGEQGYHVPSKYIHSNVFDRNGYFEGVHYSKFEPVIAYLRGRNGNEFKDCAGITDVFRKLVEDGWTSHEMRALGKLLVHEGLMMDENKIYERIEKETSRPDFLSGIINPSDINKGR